ncbi:putative inactive receptor kinase [Forsythia ovata]|uniref:Inactive receptor kinase n=1 Tax=Forsythia ovata TaxID=205694 RepID=A0ABD1PFG4_9LAMI
MAPILDFLPRKSVEDQFPLDWESRLRIAIGAARSVAHIHSQSGGTLVHGNIKSSNIFLNSQQYDCVSDISLATLMSPVVPPVIRTAGYCALEVTDFRKVSHASDIFSFGVLLLELLTGKSPVHATGSDEVIHLVRWVHSFVHEEWTGEVFDIELLRYPNIEEKMVTMLKIDMSCVERISEKRPKMADVVKMLEDIRSINAVLLYPLLSSSWTRNFWSHFCNSTRVFLEMKRVQCNYEI